jgi:hypothetical protein
MTVLGIAFVAVALVVFGPLVADRAPRPRPGR